jgi:hypothetical protein
MNNYNTFIKKEGDEYYTSPRRRTYRDTTNELKPIINKLLESKLYFTYNIKVKCPTIGESLNYYNLKFNYELVDKIYNIYFPELLLHDNYDIKIIKLKNIYNKIMLELKQILGDYPSIDNLKQLLITEYDISSV